jgi:hypothetical protein
MPLHRTSAVCIVVALAAEPPSAMAEPIPLAHGNYVQGSVSCKAAPFAAIIAYDGRGFGGAHESKCDSRIVSQSNNIYRLSTTCSSAGDGSHVDTATTAQTIVLRSKTSFKVMPPDDRDSDGVFYRLCDKLN